MLNTIVIINVTNSSVINPYIPVKLLAVCLSTAVDNSFIKAVCVANYENFHFECELEERYACTIVTV